MDEQLEPGPRIRRRRLEQKLSRQTLAQTAGLDIAVVRRIEHGAYARCEEALAIAQALNVSADELFNGVFDRLKQFQSNAALTESAWEDKAFREEIAAYGIDIHPALWFLKLRFRGGGEASFAIAGPDLDRFHEALGHEGEEGHPAFVVFDSSLQTVGINLNEVVQAHALFEGADGDLAPDEGPSAVEVLLAGEKTSLSFGADADVSDDPDDPCAYHGQLHALLDHIEQGSGGKPFATFFDHDGEQVALRVNAIAFVTVPHMLLWGIYDEDLEDLPEPQSPPRRPQLKVLEGGR